MQFLLEFMPIVAFVVAYKWFGGIYVATIVLMVGMVLSLALLWLRAGARPNVFAASTLLALVFGAATLLLRDVRFIQWKYTVFIWLAALAFLVSAFVGRQLLVQRMLRQVVDEAAMTRGDWLKLNTAWVLYGFSAGTANILVARHAPMSFWVGFKIWGLMGLMIVFLIGQFYWLHARGKLKTDDAG